MHYVNDVTLKIVDFKNSSPSQSERNIFTLLVKYDEVVKGDMVYITAYDSYGNKYTVQQNEFCYKHNIPLYAVKTSAQALKLKNDSLVNFNDYKRAKEERTATRKEKFIEGFKQLKIAASHQLEKFFDV